jgi:hypothetical protein
MVGVGLETCTLEVGMVIKRRTSAYIISVLSVFDHKHNSTELGSILDAYHKHNRTELGSSLDTSPGAEIELTTLVGIWCQLLFFIHF